MAKPLFFKKDNVLHRVNSEDIYFFQANGDYSLAISVDSRYMPSMGIKDLAELLINDGFVQVHRSYLINVTKIDSIDLITSKINICNHEIPMSKNRKKQLLAQLRIVK